ncbi:hypothetical protein H4R18_000583 [Coemansia javaensis]|uniref:Uncharacterized protein n=1 Tax=Coemansia javaensis TaxID=2761396 RepID=A0A9W8HHP1_9FUNG|nr:hypothetical protein H4R18_000583 [Coemansia javaensis]
MWAQPAQAAQPAAQRLPSECLHGILDYLWGDGLAGRFLERRSQYACDYDQRRIHRALAARSPAPLHVCRAWRAGAARRFFRYAAVDLRAADNGRPLLPLSAQPFVDRLLVQLPPIDSPEALPALALRISRGLPHALPRARVLGLCFAAEPAGPPHALLPGAREVARALRAAAPLASRVWFQSLGPVSGGARHVLEALLLLAAPQPPAVVAVHVPLLSARNPHGISLVRACARDLEFLSLGSVFGGALSDLVDGVVYGRLRRLLFTVDAGAHIHTRITTTGHHHPNHNHNHNHNHSQQQGEEEQASPFPRLEELYFDDTLSNGLPREEWYAPLYDMFLRHRNPALRYLTFPIVYNTQRTVGRHNCPRLAGLRHIKCCWATGGWSALQQQQDSDSTRVLKAIATIPTLECYVHPSYIARLSALPAEISCRDLTHLDLYGWPLTLADISWILRVFGRLQTLRVTPARSLDDNNDNDNGNGNNSSNGAAAALEPPLPPLPPPTQSPVRRLAVGATDSGLVDADLERLLAILRVLPRLVAVSLYGGAYAYIKRAADAGSSALRGVRIANLDSCELLGQAAPGSGRSFWSPLAQLTTAVASLSARASGTGCTTWNVVRQLLVD